MLERIIKEVTDMSYNELDKCFEISALSEVNRMNNIGISIP